MKEPEEVLPDLNSTEVQDATVKIQAAFRGHKARQEVKERRQVDDSSETEDSQDGKVAATSDSTETETEEDSLPNLEDSDVENAAIKIQSVYRGFQARKKHPPRKHDFGEIAHAAVTIQRAYRRYKKTKSKVRPGPIQRGRGKLPPGAVQKTQSISKLPPGAHQHGKQVAKRVELQVSEKTDDHDARERKTYNQVGGRKGELKRGEEA